jgi:hypothetical protein
MPFTTGDNNFGVAKWIVNSTAGLGTHTTLATAMTAASSGDTIFLMTSVTENVTITPGVNITAWAGGTLNTPSITGTLTMTGAGTSTLSGLELITNSAAVIAVTGSAASILNVNNCYLNFSNNSGITFSSSSGSSVININNCTGNIGTTGIKIFAHTSAGTLAFYSSVINNTGASTTASTATAGTLNAYFSQLASPITTSSTSTLNIYYSTINTASQNAIAATIGGSGTNGLAYSYFFAGTASAISIGATVNMYMCTVDSTNTNAITGAGTCNQFGINYSNTSHLNNTTTLAGGAIAGLSGVAPNSGFIGERITSTVTGVSVPNGTATNITSINLTIGVWDISGIIDLNNSGTSTAWQSSLSSTSATIQGTIGDQATQFSVGTALLGGTRVSMTVPSYRVLLTSSATYYLVGLSNFSTGTCTGAGRISAVRVG